MSSRTVLHDPAIARVAFVPQVLVGLERVARNIDSDVQARTSRSRTIRPFGKMMSVDRTETGVRVGTSWGPAVPVEYGTSRTPAQRVLLGAAENHGRVEFR